MIEFRVRSSLKPLYSAVPIFPETAHENPAKPRYKHCEHIPRCRGSRGSRDGEHSGFSMIPRLGGSGQRDTAWERWSTIANRGLRIVRLEVTCGKIRYYLDVYWTYHYPLSEHCEVTIASSFQFWNDCILAGGKCPRLVSLYPGKVDGSFDGGDSVVNEHKREALGVLSSEPPSKIPFASRN